MRLCLQAEPHAEIGFSGAHRNVMVSFYPTPRCILRILLEFNSPGCCGAIMISGPNMGTTHSPAFRPGLHRASTRDRDKAMSFQRTSNAIDGSFCNPSPNSKQIGE